VNFPRVPTLTMPDLSAKRDRKPTGKGGENRPKEEGFRPKTKKTQGERIGSCQN
jgi:hypothetical protein